MPLARTLLSSLQVVILLRTSSPAHPSCVTSLVKISSTSKRRRIAIARWRLRLNALVPELLLQVLDIALQRAVLTLDILGVASTPRETSDPIGGSTFGVVLGARRATAWSGIAADLPDLVAVVSALHPHIHWTSRTALTLHRSQAWPVRLELAAPPPPPFRPPFPAPPPSYSIRKSVRDDLFGNGLSASSPGRLLEAGIACASERNCLMWYIDKPVWKLPRRVEVAASRSSRLPSAKPKAARTANKQ